jgi:hypothetical protein
MLIHMTMKNNINQATRNVYAWCCDYENYRGEGRLARCFVEHVVKKKNYNFYIQTPHYYFQINNKNIQSINTQKKKKN